MAKNGMRLIDANELDGKLEALAQKYAAQGRPEVAKDYSFVQTILLTARTVYAAEAVHAYWDEDGRCSHCKEEAITEWNEVGGGYIFTRFCPFCGAKMDADAAEQPEERV